VVIVAAGQGTRIGSETPKQYLEIAGVPMLLRSVRPFARHPAVAHVVIVLRPSDAARPPAWLAGCLGEALSVVAGGAERGDSVAAGLAALPSGCRIVLVHDAARPFVDQPLIDRIIDAARSGEAAVPALPVTDTIKRVDPGDPSRIAGTVPRDQLRSVQTPQGFPRNLLVAAHARAREAGVSGTDDAALVELAGDPVRLVPGDPRNFKVTTADDLAFADYLARRDP
jgi:2-C-methyl-D-erythritol 4-phosphate cytidylyltransferase